MLAKASLIRRLTAISAALAIVGALLVPSFSSAPAGAVSSLDFNPGNIVSDALFYDGLGMSSIEIQNFLNGKVPHCTIGDPGRTAGMVWGSTTISDTCLRDFGMTTSTRAANAYCSSYVGSTRESAAQIIAKVGAACGISPKVLLVMLEKEQTLVSDSWPTVRQFDVAMGYGCPDSGPGHSANCDANYYGFFNQVYLSAWQLKVYRGNPNNYNYKPFQVNTIKWNPNPDCGTSQVQIQNWATAALYIYTPYRPNQAALNAGWGTGDGCSSYGNRNFFLFFSTWFGTGPPEYQTAIDSKWSQNPWLGAPQSEYNSFTANGGGVVRAYQYGAITWASGAGAHVLSGGFRDFYNSRGGVGGPLGWPTTDVSNRADNRSIQGYTLAAATFTPEHGFAVLSGSIRNHYNSHAFGLDGPLGWPTGDASCSSVSVCTQPFEFGSIAQSGNSTSIIIPDVQALLARLGTTAGEAATALNAIRANGGGFVLGMTRGAITWSKASGAHFVSSGPIRDRFNSLGGLVGTLGWPKSDRESIAEGIYTQVFNGGSLWETPDGSVTYMNEGISDRYIELLQSTNTVGFPVGDSITRVSNGGGVVQGFTLAAMTWSDRTGAVVLKEPVRAPYNAQGGLDSMSIGWPFQDAVSLGGGNAQAFERAVLFVNPAGEASLIRPDLAIAYETTYGGPAGILGWPIGTTNNSSSSKGVGAVQGFESGALVSFPTVGEFIIQGEIRRVYNLDGGLSGSLGWPTSNVNQFTANGGGSVQGFENAAILSSPSGTFSVSGGIREYYATLNSFSGSLGWPTSAQTCSAADICTQSFQNGTLSWSPVSGGSRI